MVLPTVYLRLLVGMRIYANLVSSPRTLHFTRLRFRPHIGKSLRGAYHKKQSITILRWPGGANDKDEAIGLLVKCHFLPFCEDQDEYILY